MKARKSLKGIRILRSLDAAEIAALNHRCSWRRVQPDEWLIHQDDTGTETYFLIDGALRIIMNTFGGSDVILADMNAGDYFGEMPAIDGQPQSAGVIAIRESTVASMPASVFKQLLHRHPLVIEHVLRDFVCRMRSLQQRISELQTLSIRRRIYAELLRQSRADPIDEIHGRVSPVPRHAELAARVGTRRETVTRELKALERAGFFTKCSGALVINRREISKRVSRDANPRLSSLREKPE